MVQGYTCKYPKQMPISIKSKKIRYLLKPYHYLECVSTVCLLLGFKRLKNLQFRKSHSHMISWKILKLKLGCCFWLFGQWKAYEQTPVCVCLVLRKDVNFSYEFEHFNQHLHKMYIVKRQGFSIVVVSNQCHLGNRTCDCWLVIGLIGW